LFELVFGHEIKPLCAQGSMPAAALPWQF
jgi:hypothetical protein